MRMPNHLVSLLGTTFGFLACAYISLLGSTVYFAARQAELSVVRIHTASVVEIKGQNYLARIKEMTTGDRIRDDFVSPRIVVYAEAPSGLSRANQ